MNAPETINSKPSPDKLSQLFVDFINDKSFPCIAAKSSVHAGNIAFYEATHMACPHDDTRMLSFLYNFVDDYRNNIVIDDHTKKRDGFCSAVIIFKAPEQITEQQFEVFLWMRLQALHDLDRINYKYDPRVDSQPLSEKFSFSLKEEAFFIIGMHAGSSRASRRFSYPALAFNPHEQFERLRAVNRYEPLKDIIRKRDINYSGSVNPMLEDFGRSSEVYQYSGMQYDNKWRCPLLIDHGKNEYNSPA